MFHPTGGETLAHTEDRVSRVTVTSYAVLYGKAPFASGRAEDSRSFSRTCGSKSHMFVKKIKQYHAAAGESGCHLVKRSV